ncbi:MAG: signal recognition particle-docking protein FtsY [Candidatus Scatovivens sp.]
MGFFSKFKKGLEKTRNSIDEKINNVFSNFRKVDEELLEELEEILIMSDFGMETSVNIIDKLRNKIKKEKIEDEENVRKALKDIIKEILDSQNAELILDSKPAVILVVGVNGVGKTTTIGKLANKLTNEGKKVVLAAADTFRAAAVEQLEIWAERSNSIIVKKEEGADPASVVFDSIKKAREENADVLICDTAGRLHNKKYLMDELAKIKKVIEKEFPDTKKEVLMVLDAETGQNAISQVKAFKETTDITGIVLTKLDGTAKGGVVIGIVDENKVPVKFIGIGEKIEDLEKFNSDEFLDAII